ncbi:MAG: SDR family oxidoreductase [Acidobacteriota bacterium]
MTPTSSANDRAIVVTGASTGIGEASARALAARGFRVFAGVRKPDDAERLAATEGIEAVQLDVTRAEDIAAAAELVEEWTGDRGLWGLFNNAGITVSAPLEFLDLEDLRRQFEVNLFGQLAVTQALLPQLRKARGRVVNTGSVGGFVATPVLAPYCMTKFAMEGFSDALRMELAPWEIEVSLLQPAAIATPIWDKGVSEAETQRHSGPPAMEQLYGPLLERMQKLVGSQGRGAAPPSVVADAAVHAFTARRPKTRYVMGTGARLRQVLRRLPDRWRDQLMLRSFHWTRGSRA